jgi:tetratricopeptide (TPR) repeat protein
MKQLFLFILCGGLLGLSGSACTTSRLEVHSEPEGADVIALPKGQTPIKLGVTPLTVNQDSHPELFSSELRLRVTKDGYSTESVLVPHSSLGSETRLDLDLPESKLPASCSQSEQIINDITQKLAQSQLLVFRKNFVEAKQQLIELSNRYSNVAVIYTLLGNISYVEKNLTAALDYYKRAKALAPENAETNRMIEKINMIKGDKP